MKYIITCGWKERKTAKWGSLRRQVLNFRAGSVFHAFLGKFLCLFTVAWDASTYDKLQYEAVLECNFFNLGVELKATLYHCLGRYNFFLCVGLLIGHCLLKSLHRFCFWPFFVRRLFCFSVPFLWASSHADGGASQMGLGIIPDNRVQAEKTIL